MENKRKISAKIVADSIDSKGNRITTFVLTYPRFIHAELLTHRLFSRNAASSRAIPFKKMVEDIENDPFISIAWQKDHKGMQGVEYLNKENSRLRTKQWLLARDSAVEWSTTLNSKLETFGGDLIDNGNTVTKQLCNRLLEPFQWYTCLVTATEFYNFFNLRCPQYYYEPENLYFKSKKDWNKKWLECFDKLPYSPEEELIFFLNISKSGAEIHIQALAEAMWDARNESTPNELEAGEWHMPFMGNFDSEKLLKLSGQEPKDFELICRKIATARAARLSYMTFDGEIDYEKDISLHDTLLASRHASAFEHCCRVLNKEEYNTLGKMTLHPEKGYVFEKGWVDNIRGFISYRRILNI